MTKVDFSANLRNAEREGLITSDRFKFKEGVNRIRLLSECLPHQSSYQGNRRFQWLCYVLDRFDGQIKTFFMPHTIYKQIVELQKSDDYAFDAVPMPYDITVNAKGAGTKEVEYAVVPARKNTELTLEEQVKFGAMKPIKEVQDAIRAKAEENGTAPAPETTFDPDDERPDTYPAKSTDRMPA